MICNCSDCTKLTFVSEKKDEEDDELEALFRPKHLFIFPRTFINSFFNVSHQFHTYTIVLSFVISLYFVSSVYLFVFFVLIFLGFLQKENYYNLFRRKIYCVCNFCKLKICFCVQFAKYFYACSKPLHKRKQNGCVFGKKNYARNTKTSC